MLRPFALITLALTAVMAFLVGVTSGSLRTPAPPATPSPQVDFVTAPSRTAAPATLVPTAEPAIGRPATVAPGLVNFADVAETLNPAVVNIEATTRGGRRRRAPETAR